MNILIIGFGGALGAIARYLINEILTKYLPSSFPTGIFLVNIIGCFLVGYFINNMMIAKDNNYYFFIVGFLGSFTTMSAFTYQSIELFNTNALAGSSYIISTIIFCIIATYIGLTFSR
jgi:CrcB protein